jgi:serine/threonine-protein kinase
VIEKDELMREIWADTIVEENNLNKNISILRRILGENKNEHRFIVTIPGRGYKFVAEVREMSEVQSLVESEISASEFQNESESQDNSAPEIWNLEPETNQNRRPKTKDQKPNRFQFVALAVLIIFSIGTIGFYLWHGSEKSVDLPIKTVAVLPFKPLVLENRNEALELGMADTLINKISSSEEIIVRPLGSVRRFNKLEQDVLQAGRELGVDSVLEGTIQTSGERIRIAARLVRTGDGKQLWTETFDENFTDIFAVQDSISQKVLAALTLKLSGEAQKRLTKHDTENVEAYQLYMKGRFHASRLILPEAKKGIEYFNQAIALDPNYALAYVGIAQAYTGFSLSGDVPANDAMPKAKTAALRAIELDANLPESQVAVGFLAFWYDWNWSEAEKKYQRALELDPNNASAHYFFAHLNSNLGRHAEALTMAKRARELDPLSLLTNSVEGQFLFYAGRGDEAIARYNKTLEIEPNFWIAHNGLGRVYIRQKRYDEAIAALTKAKEFSGASTEPVTQLGYALAKSGRRDETRATLEELKAFAAENFVPAYNFAMIYNGLDEKEEALNYLEKSFQEREAQMAFIKIDTRWDWLRAEPRFVEIIKQMNFEQTI